LDTLLLRERIQSGARMTTRGTMPAAASRNSRLRSGTPGTRYSLRDFSSREELPIGSSEIDGLSAR